MSSLSGGSTGPAALPGQGTVTFADSFTYAGASDTAVNGALTVRAGTRQRPLIRLAGALTLTGSPRAHRTPDGMFLSGGDIVRKGEFERLTLTCSTLDPGSAVTLGPAQTSPFAVAADGRLLSPTRVWVEGRIATLTVDRCVLGPIRTRAAGSVETACIGNSTLQAIATSMAPALTANDVKDPTRFEQRLQQGVAPVSAPLRNLSAGLGPLPGGPTSPPFSDPPPPASDLAPLIGLVNDLIAGPSIFDTSAFADVPMSARTRALLAGPGADSAALNR